MPFKRIWAIHPSVKELWANPKLIPKLQVFFEHLMTNLPESDHYTRSAILNKAASVEFKVFGKALDNLLGPNTRQFSRERLKEISNRLQGVQTEVRHVNEAKSSYGIDFTSPVGVRVLKETEREVELQIEPINLTMTNRQNLSQGDLYLPHETDPETAYVATPLKSTGKPPVYSLVRLVPFRDPDTNALHYFVQNLQPKKRESQVPNQVQKTYRFLDKWSLMAVLNYARTTGAAKVFISRAYASQVHGLLGDHHERHVLQQVRKKQTRQVVRTAWADYADRKIGKDEFIERAKEGGLTLPKYLTDKEAERLYEESPRAIGFRPFASDITVKEKNRGARIPKPLVYPTSEDHPLSFLVHRPFRQA